MDGTREIKFRLPVDLVAATALFGSNSHHGASPQWCEFEFMMDGAEAVSSTSRVQTPIHASESSISE